MTAIETITEKECMAPQNLLSISAVVAKTSKSRSGIYAAIKDGTFPKPVAIGPRRVAFIEAEIDAWIVRKVVQARS